MTTAAPSTEPSEPDGRAAGPTWSLDAVVPQIGQAEFLAKVSHAIRTPLTSIIGFSQLLRDRTGEEDGPSADVAEMLEVIERNAHRLEHLVSDLVLLGCLADPAHPVDREPIDVAHLLAEAGAKAEPLAHEEGVELIVTAEAGPPALGDRGCLLAALHALLANAVAASPTGGQVRATAHADADGWWIHVDDDGLGIAADEQALVFEPFHRGANVAGTDLPGAGLGLSIVAAVARIHGGRLTLTSTEGVGTRVRVGLPSAL
jgi:two-component system phosphate regulon sensor histidine kinase PhoR